MNINCRQASRLISQGLDQPLGRWSYLRLRVHLAMCGNCRQFSRQLAAMRQAARAAGDGKDAPTA
ncbi:zf-HC2 domain-containing protein [uncultured Aquitalea sp.]|uniref:zf-HC2 domain-containing protein n=1 Tax=uncultured Aquitalea sp. TaxID=540272 RepID=UPI0025DB709A|nr:zf-HC2 domain-containing protein [uncultured Aquitalea sp.]